MGKGIMATCVLIPRQVVDPSVLEEMEWIFGDAKAFTIFLLYQSIRVSEAQQFSRNLLLSAQNAFQQLAPGGRIVTGVGIPGSLNPTDDTSTFAARAQYEVITPPKQQSIVEDAMSAFIQHASSLCTDECPVVVPPSRAPDGALNAVLGSDAAKLQSVSFSEAIKSFVPTKRTCASSSRLTHGERGMPGWGPAYVVNLGRRPDKWEDFLRLAARHDVGMAAAADFERFEAVDGSAVALTRPLRELFSFSATSQFKLSRTYQPNNPHEDHGWRKGVLGCSMSHLQIWRQMASHYVDGKDFDLEGRLVLEDDAYFEQDFASKWSSVYDRIRHDPQWDVFYLGFSDDRDIFGDPYIHPNVRRLGSTPLRSFGGGTFAYFLRNRGAKKLLNYTLKNGMVQPVDWVMIDAFQTGAIVAYVSSPHLIVSTPVQTDGSDTYIPYPLNIDELKCESASHDPAQSKEAVIASAKVQVARMDFRNIADGDRMPVDGIVQANLVVNEGVDIQTFASLHVCSRTCVQVISIESGKLVPVHSHKLAYNFPGQPEESICFRLFDPQDVHLSLPYNTSGAHRIIASIYDAHAMHLGHAASRDVHIVSAGRISFEAAPWRESAPSYKCTVRPPAAAEKFATLGAFAR